MYRKRCRGTQRFGLSSRNNGNGVLECLKTQASYAAHACPGTSITMSSLFAHPWYADLFGDAELASLLSANATLERFREVEMAWVQAQADAGISDPSICADAAARINNCVIDDDQLRLGVARDGLPIPAFVAALRAGAPAPVAQIIHTGLTSQDVMDTALVLAVRDGLGVIQTRLNALHRALQDLCTRNTGRLLMGHTRMQPALPITADARIMQWIRPIGRSLSQTDDFLGRLAILQWGGPVGVRETPNAGAVGAAFGARLGLRDPGYAWHTDRGDIADLGALLARVSGSLGKMGQDIALMAQMGAEHITLNAGGTSSAMPHKQNPILAELLVTLAKHNAGLVAGLHHALVHEQERSGSAWALEWLCLPDMLQGCGAGLNAALSLTTQIETVGTAPD